LECSCRSSSIGCMHLLFGVSVLQLPRGPNIRLKRLFESGVRIVLDYISQWVCGSRVRISQWKPTPVTGQDQPIWHEKC
jgi:hypothetical protein